MIPACCGIEPQGAQAFGLDALRRAGVTTPAGIVVPGSMTNVILQYIDLGTALIEEIGDVRSPRHGFPRWPECPSLSSGQRRHWH